MEAAVATLSPTKDTLNEAWKNDKSKFGLKMLKKMGWTEGKGLGKNEDGMSEHVKVMKKSNTLGVGAKKDSIGAAGWNSTAMSFNSVLEALGKAYGTANKQGDASLRKKAKKDRKSKDKKSKDKKSKDKKSRKKDLNNEEDPVDNSGRGCEKESIGRSGRFSGTSTIYVCPSRARRVRSKDVKGFSTDDLRAILGHSAVPVPPVEVSDDTAQDGEKQKASKKQKKRRLENDEGTEENTLDDSATASAADDTSSADDDDVTELAAKSMNVSTSRKKKRQEQRDNVMDRGQEKSKDAAGAESRRGKKRGLQEEVDSAALDQDEAGKGGVEETEKSKRREKRKKIKRQED